MSLDSCQGNHLSGPQEFRDRGEAPTECDGESSKGPAQGAVCGSVQGGRGESLNLSIYFALPIVEIYHDDVRFFDWIREALP